MFVFKESENAMDREIMESLPAKDQRDALAARVQSSNKSTFSSKIIMATAKDNPDLIKFLYDIFEKKFNPALPKDLSHGITTKLIEDKFKEFIKE